ncbi:hypothetical protein CANCADRAFT_17350, partial [Tortispora caseinolytica NRRL Y-17796]
SLRDHEKWLAEGDMVQLTEGPNKGKVGKVLMIADELNAALVENLSPSFKVINPKFTWTEKSSGRFLGEAPVPIGFEFLRLVARIPQEDGTSKRMAVAEVQLGEKRFDPRYGRYMYTRLVPGVPGLEIPWPAPEEPLKASEMEALEADAYDQSVAYSSLIDPPFPLDVVYSIRNPYSR